MHFYPQALYIHYPQEKVEGKLYEYRCQFCKRLTTEVNGKLENHDVNCQYRKQHTYLEIED
jgi:hypothetical protein